MDTYRFVFVFMFLSYERARCSIPEEEPLLESVSTCFAVQTIEDSYRLNATCPNNQVIAIQNAQIASQTLAANCTALTIQPGVDFDTCCRELPGDECLYTHVFTSGHELVTACNGQSSCVRGAVQVLPTGRCNTTIYETYPYNYMHLNYYCIDETKIIQGCNGAQMSTVGGDVRYIQSPNYRTGIAAGSTCTCSIETDDCSSGITIYTVHRNLVTDSNGSCTQQLFFETSDGSSFGAGNWSCDDNTAESSAVTTDSTYLTLTLQNNNVDTGGSFWLGFKSSGNISINCAPQPQQYCLTSSSISSDIITPTPTTEVTMTPSDTIDVTSSFSTTDISSTVSETPSMTPTMSDVSSTEMITSMSSTYTMVTSSTSDSIMTLSTSDSIMTSSTSDSIMTPSTSDSKMTSSTSDSIITSSTSDSIMTSSTSDSIITSSISDTVSITVTTSSSFIVVPTPSVVITTTPPTNNDGSDDGKVAAIGVLAVLLALAIIAIVILAVCLAKNCKKDKTLNEGDTEKQPIVSPAPVLADVRSERAPLMASPKPQLVDKNTETDPEPQLVNTSTETDPEPHLVNTTTKPDPEPVPTTVIPATVTTATMTNSKTYVDTGVSPDEQKPPPTPNVSHKATASEVIKSSSRGTSTKKIKVKDQGVSTIKFEKNGNAVHPATNDFECQVDMIPNLPEHIPPVKTKSRKTQTAKLQIDDTIPSTHPPDVISPTNFQRSSAPRTESAPLNRTSTTEGSETDTHSVFNQPTNPTMTDPESVITALHLGSRFYSGNRTSRLKKKKNKSSASDDDVHGIRGKWLKSERGTTFIPFASSNGWMHETGSGEMNGHIPNGSVPTVDKDKNIEDDGTDSKLNRMLSKVENGFLESDRLDDRNFKAKRRANTNPSRSRSRPRHSKESKRH